MVAVPICLVIRLRGTRKAIGERASDAIRIGNAARRAQKQLLGEAEDREIGPDANCQRGDGDEGKTGASAEQTRAVTKVGKESVHLDSVLRFLGAAAGLRNISRLPALSAWRVQRASVSWFTPSVGSTRDALNSLPECQWKLLTRLRHKPFQQSTAF